MQGLLTFILYCKVLHVSTMRMLYNISIGENIFALKMNMLYTCSHSSVQMGTLTDNLSAKVIISDLLV